jgi:sugar phosphate isomerase/epimerase
MKCLALAFILAQALLALPLSASDAGTGASFAGPVGLQLYSLRAEFESAGVPATLDKVKGMGIKYVELAGTYKLPPEKFKAMLDERGLIAVSGHFPYARFKSDPAGIAAEAKALGLKYAGVAWVDHKDPVDEAWVHETAKVFNAAGAALKKEGIIFFDHMHGYEFQPHGTGTLADLLITETDKDSVFFEMDVLWIIFPNQDPVKLLDTYGKRWVMMHLKDLKKGVPTGALTGHTDVKYNVVLGTGQVDWPAVLAASKKAGLAYYFIEDESPDSVTQIPLTLKYLEQVKF